MGPMGREGFVKGLFGGYRSLESHISLGRSMQHVFGIKGCTSVML